MAKERGQEKSGYVGLSIEEDFAFLQREWKTQRAGWLLLALTTLAALLGLFGRGLLSSASIAADGLHLRYERFERLQRPTSIQLRISPKPGQAIGIVIGQAYLDAIRIERIMPRPENVEADSRGLIYHFSTGGDRIEITFHMELQQFGIVSGQIGLIGGPMIPFKQFVFP